MLGTLLLMLGLWKNIIYLNAKTFFPTLLGIVDTFIFYIRYFQTLSSTSILFSLVLSDVR